MNKLSDNFTKLMIGFEGEILKGYRDSVGLLTIGIGHLVKKGEPYKLNVPISLEESRRLFAADTEWVINVINKYVKVTLSQNQTDALASLIFNIGESNFRKSELLKKLNQKNYNGAGGQFLRWVFADGKKSKGLINRRTKEMVLFGLAANIEK